MYPPCIELAYLPNNQTNANFDQPVQSDLLIPSNLPPPLHLNMSTTSDYEYSPLPDSRETSDTPDAAGMVDHNEPSKKDPMEWSRDDVQTFLRHNKAAYSLDNGDMTALQEEKISGRILLTLTKEELLADPFNLAYGAAKSLEQLISSLKITERKFYYIPLPLRSRHECLMLIQY